MINTYQKKKIYKQRDAKQKNKYGDDKYGKSNRR